VLVHGFSRADAWLLDDVELDFWLNQADRIASSAGSEE
jgi:hypothetical protein